MVEWSGVLMLLGGSVLAICFVMLVRAHLMAYRAGINLNSAYNLGFLLGIAYILQVLTGLLLAIRYSAITPQAFHMVHSIQREAFSGWLMRYVHGTTASLIFACLIGHIMRTLIVGSYAYMSMTWNSGVLLYVLSVVTAFVGYVLPWGLMSYWGATVIMNLLAGIPLIVPWLLGGFYVTDVTLRRFYVLHFMLPLVAFLAIFAHIFYLHLQGSSNPVGTHTTFKMPFGPTMLLGDVRTALVLGSLVLMQIGTAVMQLSHPDNAMPVNRLITPLHIVPEWYFLPYYATLKAIPSKLGGLDRQVRIQYAKTYQPPITYRPEHYAISMPSHGNPRSTHRQSIHTVEHPAACRFIPNYPVSTIQRIGHEHHAGLIFHTYIISKHRVKPRRDVWPGS